MKALWKGAAPRCRSGWWAVAAAGLFATGCGGSGDSTLSPEGGKDATRDVTLRDSVSDVLGLGCTSSSQCGDGGVCMANGRCCGSAQNVCGASCCTGGELCAYGKCEVPGKRCYTQQDCPSGQYCASGLGGDGGKSGIVDSGPDGPVCTESLPAEGRCFALPPTCPGDGGAEAGADAGCIPACEYHPPPGTLDAVVKWTWGPVAKEYPDFTDVWSTPTVGRLYDTNCDGKINESDTPVIVFVSGNAIGSTGKGTCCSCDEADGSVSTCHTGVLRMLDGRTGEEIWSLAKASKTSTGFLGNSIAIGDIDGDGIADIVAVTGEGYIVLLDGTGKVKRTSNMPIQGIASDNVSGWGGGLAIGDMNNDGFPEIAFGSQVFTTTGGTITFSWKGTGGTGGGSDQELSTLVDLNGDGTLELLAGNTAYTTKGTVLWTEATLPNGFNAVGDFDGKGKPQVVLVGNGQAWVLDGATGKVVLGPAALPGTGNGGPPTVASFDGTGTAEIGVAMATFYSVLKPNFATGKLDVLWSKANHDLSSSVTGSTVFNFAGQGTPQVIYADECFLWVFDGAKGAIDFATSHTSFTATEASLVADVDGDGHSEIVMVSNGADPSSAGWGCMNASGVPDTINGITWKPGPTKGMAYRGITVFGDAADSWVGTRTLWNEHTYHVSNICDDLDNACKAPNKYGSIPKVETPNWTLPWLNNFRQNVQGAGIFNAPDAVVDLTISCGTPLVAQVTVRNIGSAGLPSDVMVQVFVKSSPADVMVGTTATTFPLLPSQAETLSVTLSAAAKTTDTFYAQIFNDPKMPTFHECRTDNDQSGLVKAACAPP